MSPCHLLGSAQRFFRALAFSNIDDGAHELHQITNLIADRMTDPVDMLDRTARVNNSIVHFEIGFLANRVPKQLPDSVLVPQTRTSKKCWIWRSGFRIETRGAIRLLRRVPDFARPVPGPTPGMAQALRFRQIVFALAASLFRQLALNGHAREIVMCVIVSCSRGLGLHGS